MGKGVPGIGSAAGLPGQGRRVRRASRRRQGSQWLDLQRLHLHQHQYWRPLLPSGRGYPMERGELSPI